LTQHNRLEGQPEPNFEVPDSSPALVSENPQCDGVQNDEGQPQPNLEVGPFLTRYFVIQRRMWSCCKCSLYLWKQYSVLQQYSVSFVNYCADAVIPVSAIVDVVQSEQLVQEIVEPEISSNDASISAEPEQREITCLTRGRKKSRNTAEWTANKQQRLRQSGKHKRETR